MPGRGHPAGVVGRADRGDVGGRISGGIDDHEWDVARSQLVLVSRRQIRGDKDHSDWFTLHGRVDPAGCGGMAIAALDHRQAETVFARHPCSPANEFDGPRSIQGPEDQVDRRRERLGGAALPISVEFEQLGDAFARVAGDAGTPIQDFGCRRQGDGGIPCDIFQRRGLVKWRRRLLSRHVNHLRGK